MKTQKEVEKMLSFIGYFNDGLFMNIDYREGIRDALSFVLYNNQKLDKILKEVNSLSLQG